MFNWMQLIEGVWEIAHKPRNITMSVSNVNGNNSNNHNSSSGVSSTPVIASGQEVANAQASVKRTREQIKTHINNLASGLTSGANNQNLLDIDGDGQVNEFDSKLIGSYINGQRGVQLRDEVSPYANSSISAIREMEAKIETLIGNKTLDVDNDGKVDSKDAKFLKEDVKKFQDDQSKAQLQKLIREGGFDIDGNGTTDDKDIKFLRDHFVKGKSAVSIARDLAGPNGNPSLGAVEGIQAKLTALSNNRFFDFNTDGQITNKDIDNIAAELKILDKATKQSNRTSKVEDLINNKTIDVDGDGRVTNDDIDIIQAYRLGVRGKGLKRRAGAGSELTAEQIAAKTKALFDNKSIDVNGNNIIGGTDISILRKAAKANEEKLIKETISSLISNKTIDADASGSVDNKDIDLIDAYRKGKRGDKLKKHLPNGANVAQAEAKIAALIDNFTIDVNKDGKVDNEDIKLIRKQRNNMASA